MPKYPDDIYEDAIIHGGGTYHLDNTPVQKHGFAVSIVNGTFALIPGDGEFVSVVDFYNALTRLMHEFPDVNAYGTWYADGLIHLDPVQIFENEDDARNAAVRLMQRAYYNLNTSTEVYV